MRVAVLGSALALTAGVVAGCGGDDGDGVEPDAFVGDVCSAFDDFQSTLSEGVGAISAVGQADPEEGKELLVDFFDEGAAAASELTGEIENAGAPDVEGGEETADAVQEATRGLADALERARDQAEDLPTDSPEAFRSGAEELNEEFQASVDEVGEATDEIEENAELEEAAEENPECQQLESGTTGTTGATGA